MSIKDKIGKMKSFLFDDEDDDSKKISIKKPIKEHREEKKEVEEDTLSKTKEIESLYFEDISEPDIEIEEPKKEEVIKSRSERKEFEFDFPDFNDNDFMKPVEDKKPEPVVSYVREEVKTSLYQGSKRGTESKRFKPTPMISPVYGLLDEDGMTISHDSAKKERMKDEVSIDDVRKKAFGSYEDDIRLKTIEEAEKDMEEEEKNGEIEKVKVIKEDKVVVNDDDDDMILPNINFKEIDIDDELKPAEEEASEIVPTETPDEEEEVKEEKAVETSDDDEDDDEDTKEQDLFNLIDSMYQKEGEEE